MIIRYRPKHLTKQMLDECCQSNTIGDENSFYFDSGRATLKATLTHLSKKYCKKINVGIQNFNCYVVVDAALEAGCTVTLLDIKESDFSVSFDNVKEAEIDVLLLLHYQGVPNQEYIKICEYCKKYNIIIVEDMAQAYNSSIEGVMVRSLGDMYIESYSFDKPFVSLFGGGLFINQNSGISNVFDDEWLRYYNGLESESIYEHSSHIKLLNFLLQFTTPKYYKPYMTQYEAMLSQIEYIDDTDLFENKVLSYLKERIKNSKEEILPKRISLSKARLVSLQKENFVKPKIDDWMLELTNKKYPNSVVNWNRFSFIGDKSAKNKIFKKYNGMIEIGNYNWPTTMDRIYHLNPNVYAKGNYTVSQYVSENIINVPIWQFGQYEDNI